MIILENKERDLSEKEDESVAIASYPITTNTFHWTPLASVIFTILHILSILMPLVMILTFFPIAMDSSFLHWRLFIIFIDVFAWWGAYLLISLILGKLFLIALKLLHKPHEGLFKIDKGSKDYNYFCLRVVVKKFVFWIWNNFCFPWATNLAFKLLGVRTDFKSTLFDEWLDAEFIELGDNIMVGQGAVIMSSMIVRIDNYDYILIKKVIIGDHVVLGGHSIVAPGTIIGKGTTLGIWAVTHIGQILQPKYIYIGQPARKYQPTQKAFEESKKVFFRRMVDTNERVSFDIYKGDIEKKFD